MFLNVMAVDPNFVMQTLGAIVQAYASILALVGAFYVFLIERINTQYEEVADDQYSRLRKLEEYFDGMDLNFMVIMEHGVDHFLKNDRIKEETKNAITQIGSWDDVVYYQNKYEILKNKRGSWTYKHFSNFFIFCLVILILSILNMYMLGTGTIDISIFVLFTLIVALSIFGFAYFMKLCRDLAKIGDKPDSEKDRDA